MPLHSQICITLLAGCFTFCVALVLTGALLRRSRTTLPAVPLFPGSDFPGIFTKFYITFFFITFIASLIEECRQGESGPLTEEQLPDLVMSCCMQILLYAPLLVAYFRQPRRNRPAFSFWRRLKWWSMGILLLMLPGGILQVSGFTPWLIEATGCPSQQSVVEYVQHSPLSIKIIVIFMAVIVAPLTEECCFRGCLYNILRQYASPALAAMASGLLFGAVHNSLAQFLPLTLFGIFQCYAYERARSLWLPISLHMLFNAISIIAILLCPIP